MGSIAIPWGCAHYHPLFCGQRSKTTLVGVSRVASPQVPLAALKEKAKLYVDQGLIRQDMAERVIRVIESERGDSFYVNDVPADAQAAAGGGDSLSTRLSPEQMQALLEKRVEMMKEGTSVMALPSLINTGSSLKLSRVWSRDGPCASWCRRARALVLCLFQ